MDQPEEQAPQPEVSYHAVEKDGEVTAIWEMAGRKHLRTIDPRSEEGKRILGSHTVDEPGEQVLETQAAAHSFQGES